MHWGLRQRGERLLLSRHALVRHVNFSLPGVFFRAQILNGRNFAGVRSREWRVLRRVLWVMASPLIPIVRAWRLRRAFAGAGAAGESAPWRALPVFLFGLALDGAGQALGYARGPGNDADQLAHYEFARSRFITADDRRALERPRSDSE